MRSLSDLVDLTDAQARSQWGRVLQRAPRSRQEAFTPVEVILCYGLFRLVDPHRYRGGSTDQPLIVHTLASLFQRSPSSITSKMKNLDGSLSHSGAHEWRFFAEMSVDVRQFPQLYNRVLLAARDMGIGPERLPDFLALDGSGDFDLLGQEELARHTLDEVVAIRAARHRARPWTVCNDTERLDERNGVAACGVHDAAFDTGLITVNGGLRVHRARRLEISTRDDPGVERYFGQVLRPRLVLPSGAVAPDSAYLEWHRENVYVGGSST